MPTRPPGTPDVDLTELFSYGLIGEAVFSTGQTQPAGTGAFNAFVQIQHKGTEQGYNTDANAQYDEKNSHQHNHSILLAEVPVVIGDGTNGTTEGRAYREFLLDLNEPNGGSKPYISLDALQIWQQEAGNLTNFTPGAGFAGAHTNYLAYNLDSGGNHWIALNDGLSHGSGQSDVRILIPDDFFINDAAHRYVTLYSKFGEQNGWDSDGGFEEWGLHGASGGPVSAIAVDKTATVAGGTADAVGEVITYTIKVGNTGNTVLTGLTVVDPFITNLTAVMSGAFNVGDTNMNGQFNAGETWQYSGTYTVTQADLDNGGNTGDGTITNTVTADTNQTAAVSDTSVVTVEQQSALVITKMADVPWVDEAGDEITYSVTVQNTGSVTLVDLHVTDPLIATSTPQLDFGAPVLSTNPLLAPKLDGDYNVGDTNQNGVEDPGETFQYIISGDDNENGIQDPGENFTFTNVGDTNQNGNEDPGETFQFYNAGDTDHDGEEDPGETFQFIVNDNLTSVDLNNDNYNDGDINHDNLLNVGETWLFTTTYTVTQDDIDNGGIVQPGLTLDNTVTAATSNLTETASVSVDILQNPHVTLTKTATVPGGTVDTVGEVIDYAISIANDGNMTLTNVSVDDPSVTDLAAVESGGFNTGDLDMDGVFDVNEIWQYVASHTVTQGDIDNGGVVEPGLTISNTATVTTDQATDSDTASVDVVQNPHVSMSKTGTVPGGTADTAGEVISYTITITNDGNMTLSNVGVSDPSATTLAAVESGGFNAGDINTDGFFDVGEIWEYAATHTVTQGEIDDNGGGDGFIDNTASVSTDQGANANASASIEVEQPAPAALALDKSDAVGTHFVDSDEDGHADVGTDLIQYAFQITNTGGVVLHDVVISDALFGGTIYGPEVLDPGETFTFSLNHFLTADDVAALHVSNTATASGLDPSNNVISVMAFYDQVLPA